MSSLPPLQIVTRLLADLGEEIARAVDQTAFGVGCDGSAVLAIARTAEPRRETHASGVSFAKSRFDVPASYDVLRIAPDGRVEKTSIGEEQLAVRFVQVHPEGVLLSSGRCRWRAEGPEQNAVIRRWDGTVVRRLTLGDGIADLRVTPDGTIWCSYFDEGVFGNYGWGGPGPEPIGHPGIVAFDARGSVRRAFDAEAAGTDHVADVYALNVAGDDDVWAYFYTDFPIVHLTREGTRAWTPNVGGARALAVRGERALLVDDYDRRDVVRMLALEGEDARTVAKGTLVDEKRRPIPRAYVLGAGETLFAFDGRHVRVARDWHTE